MPGTNQTKENLFKTMLTGMSGILTISEYSSKVFRGKDKSTLIAAVIALIFLLIFHFTHLPLYTVIVEVVNLLIAFIPGILGFTIGGYALTVGFVQAGMLNRISEKQADSDYSLYQKMSSTFALCIILQALSLVLAYIYHFIIFIQSTTKTGVSFSPCILLVVNSLATFLILLAFWLSLVLSVQVVINIFNFSQLHHYLINKEKLEEK